MKQISPLLNRIVRPRLLAAFTSAAVALGLLALAANNLPLSARADSRERREAREEINQIYQKVQLAELHQLEEVFHHAGSYGGNLDEMMSVWAENSTLTAGPNVYRGKDAIRAFFAAAGPFNNNWVGLTKAFVFTADIHGDTAELSFQCDYADAATGVIKVNSQLSGTVRKIHGQWLFWNMTPSAVGL